MKGGLLLRTTCPGPSMRERVKAAPGKKRVFGVRFRSDGRNSTKDTDPRGPPQSAAQRFNPSLPPAAAGAGPQTAACPSGTQHKELRDDLRRIGGGG